MYIHISTQSCDEWKRGEKGLACVLWAKAHCNSIQSYSKWSSSSYDETFLPCWKWSFPGCPKWFDEFEKGCKSYNMPFTVYRYRERKRGHSKKRYTEKSHCVLIIVIYFIYYYLLNLVTVFGENVAGQTSIQKETTVFQRPCKSSNVYILMG